MTKRQAASVYLADILPDVLQWENDSRGGRVHRPSRRKSWGALCVALRAAGEITIRQAATWSPPACVYVGPS